MYECREANNLEPLSPVDSKPFEVTLMLIDLSGWLQKQLFWRIQYSITHCQASLYHCKLDYTKPSFQLSRARFYLCQDGKELLYQ